MPEASASAEARPPLIEAERRQVDLTDRPAIAAYVVLAGFVVLALGHPVPNNNEHHYLVAAYRLFHPDFAISDPGLGDPLYGHLIVQTIAGGLMTVLPLEVVGWLLRLTSWSAVIASIVLVASRLGVRPWITAVAVVVWLTNQQTILGHEWVMGGAEAKTFAYPLLFMSTYLVLEGRPYWAATLIGLAVSLHPVVGVQFGGAICLASLFVRPRTWRVLQFAGLVVLFSLPGVVATLYGSAQGQPLTSSDWEFLARYALPFHVDPTTFPRRSYLVLIVLLSFDLLVCWRLREERPYRLWGVTLAALTAVFIGGLFIWMAGAFSLLQFMPFRVLPVLTLLLFPLFLADILQRRLTAPAIWALGVWGLLAVGEPVAGFVDMRIGQNEANRYPTGVFDWIAESTPADALILSPPDATNSISRSRRGQVAYYRWVRTRDLDNWRRGLEAVLGPAESAGSEADWLARYGDLTEADVARLRRDYGATHFVTRGTYDLPLAFEDSDGWRVYALEAVGPTSE